MGKKITRAHIYIEGRVQGVSYRWWVLRQAQDLRLTGWVKNLADGRVEAVFEGPKKEVEKIIKKCRKGPMLAGVKHIDVIWEKPKGEFPSFQIVA